MKKVFIAAKDLIDFNKWQLKTLKDMGFPIKSVPKKKTSVPKKRTHKE